MSTIDDDAVARAMLYDLCMVATQTIKKQEQEIARLNDQLATAQEQVKNLEHERDSARQADIDDVRARAFTVCGEMYLDGKCTRWCSLDRDHGGDHGPKPTSVRCGKVFFGGGSLSRGRSCERPAGHGWCGTAFPTSDRERLLEEARAIIKDFMQDHGDVDEAHTCEWCKPAIAWLSDDDAQAKEEKP